LWQVEMRAVVLQLGLLLVLATFTVEARADLSSKQARKLITRMAGIELSDSAVRVKRISSTDASAEATAEINAIFRLATNEQGEWRVEEVRVGQDRWEPLGPVAALHTEVASSACDGPDLRSKAASEPSTKRSRCLLAAVLGVQLPSDAVRIKSVSPLELPLASHPSAIVESLITVNFRFARETGNWLVAALRTGDHDWVSPEILLASANETKTMQARGELESMARALAKFRLEYQSYVVSDSQAVLIDFLSPRFLSRVLRVDPWDQPYRYRGDRDNFTLRSFGADRKENTDDDIVVSSGL
jgi:Type II secretion system (T2SS), protein G